MIRPIDYYRPENLEEAAEMVKHDGAKILAGGTDLIVSMRNGLVRPERVVDIKGVKELEGIDFGNGELVIGATVTINDLVESETVRERFPILVEAGRVLASYQVRNRATVAGNLCNASPAADMAPALLVLNSMVDVYSLRGQREIPLRDLFTGVKKTCLAPDEILVRIRVPFTSGKGRYLKKSRTRGHDLSTVGVAAFKEDKNLKVAVGACAPIPKLVELDVTGKNSSGILTEAKNRVMGVINPIDDVRGSKEYRRAMVEVYLEKILEEIL
ncbi:MAG: xanthine dehydrogenase family protein subunit M [Firmicutes bacterium]|nr:xanthine dehydrogenase family protein subunit M [Bacillota bacterium]